MNFNKELSLVIGLAFSIFAPAGEYVDLCNSKGLPKWEVSTCLVDIKEKALRKQNVITLSIKNSTYTRSPRDIDKLDFVFENYVDLQCRVLGSANMGTGAGQEALDCEIVLIKSRTSYLQKLLKNNF
jgi:hypothetical protein